MCTFLCIRCIGERTSTAKMQTSSGQSVGTKILSRVGVSCLSEADHGFVSGVGEH